MSKLLIPTLLLILGSLQYTLWFGDANLLELRQLKQNVALAQENTAALEERNRLLLAEVNDLKTKLAAVEERARSELGMVAENEEFYQVVP